MIGLDTNILVRYLTQDDQQQWQQTVTLIIKFLVLVDPDVAQAFPDDAAVTEFLNQVIAEIQKE